MMLFKFEVKKIISSKKFIVLWILGAILISLYTFMSDRVDKSIKSSELNIYEKLIDDLNINIISLNNQIDMEKDAQIKEAMEQSLNRCQESIELNEQVRQGILDNDYKKVIEAKIKILKNQNTGMLLGGESNEFSEIEAEIEKYEYLLANEIEPINDGMAMNSINFINLVLTYMAPMLLGIIIVLSTSDIISKEIDYGTIQTLLFQNVSRRKIIISKVLASIVTNILCFISILVVIAIFLSFKNDIGSLNYPSIVRVNGVLEIYPISNLILKNSVITLSYIVFLSCFSTLISVISKNSIESMCISITICIGSTILFNNIQLPEWVKNINPFSYLAGNEVLITGFSSSSISKDINLMLISLAFIIYSIIITVLSLLKFKTKQFNIES